MFKPFHNVLFFLNSLCWETRFLGVSIGSDKTLDVEFDSKWCSRRSALEFTQGMKGGRKRTWRSFSRFTYVDLSNCKN